MTISLSRKTQKLLEKRLKRGGYATPDDVLRAALQTLDQIEAEPFEELDSATRTAIRRAEAQSARGEGRPWQQVKSELRSKYLKK